MECESPASLPRHRSGRSRGCSPGCNPAGQADPTDFPGVLSLLAELEAIDAQPQASLLLSRIADGGHFRTLLDRQLKAGRDAMTPHTPVRAPEEYKRFGFGREADGQPASRWGWKQILNS